jgi:hypothetical protein
MAANSKLGNPWPLAYGHVRASGFQSALHTLGDGTAIGINLLGEGPWSGCQARWVNGLCLGANYKSLLPDDDRFHFHPGIDAPLGATLTPNSSGGDQLVDSFWAWTGVMDSNDMSHWSTYSPTQLYLPGDIAVRGGTQPYICISPTYGNEPPNGAYWGDFWAAAKAEWNALGAGVAGSTNTDVSLGTLSTPTTFSRIAYLAWHCWPASSGGNVDLMCDYEAMMCRVYDGAGNFQALKFTTNPVWHYLDVVLRRVVQPDAVIGQPLTAQQAASIAWEEFYNAAQYCDALLANGQPRFVGNYYFSGNAATTAILERILLCCRGYARNIGGTLAIYCDQPRATKFYLTQNHIVPNSFKLDKSKLWQNGNRYKAQFNDLNIAGVAPIATVTVGTTTVSPLSNTSYQGTTIQFVSPHPFGPQDYVVIDNTDTPALNGLMGYVVYVPDTMSVVIDNPGASLVAHGGTAGLVVSRFSPRTTTEVQHASHQRAVAAQAPGSLGARRILDVPLDLRPGVPPLQVSARSRSGTGWNALDWRSSSNCLRKL